MVKFIKYANYIIKKNGNNILYESKYRLFVSKMHRPHHHPNHY